VKRITIGIKIQTTLLATVLGIGFMFPAIVKAQYTGTAYKMEEAQVGAAGSDNDLSGTTYKGRATAGDTAVGIVNGTTYQAVGGFTTSEVPELEVIAGSLNLDLGNASTTNALVGTGQFGVRVYLAQGYTVFIHGVPPTQESGYTLNTLTSQTASTVGTEQFGINLRLNTCVTVNSTCALPETPPNFGADPVQVPDVSFSFGVVNANYNTPNQFRYNNNDVIASSTSSSGVTNYKISYLINISNVTKAGTYIFNHSVDVVATY
jgi:uncharacterized protein YaiE (UPF0345 family)